MGLVVTDTGRHGSRAVALVLAALAGTALCAPPPQEDSTKTKLMSVKSGYAHRLLDAVIQEDFDAVQEQAFRLKVITETADWSAVDTPQYARLSDAFIEYAEQLRKAAEDENGDAVATAYMDVTKTCMSCHRYLKKLGE